MQNRFEQLNDLLVNYSFGNFDYKINLSSALDEVDTIISGIMMLGEELKSTTISKEYFNDIFHSVYDMLFVLSPQGVIININKSVTDKLHFEEKELLGIHISKLAILAHVDFFKDIINALAQFKIPEIETEFRTSNGKSLPVLCSCSFLKTKDGGVPDGYIFIAKDISKQKEAENMVIRAIVDTQENERHRMAQDLHDSLGQQLSAVKFYLGALENNVGFPEEKKLEIFRKSNAAIIQIMKELRSICFDLMPETLIEHGLTHAIDELCEKLKVKSVLDIQFEKDKSFPKLDKPIEITTFRIIQELLNNSIKHGKANIIHISLQFVENKISIHLNDNGRGFDFKEIDENKSFGLRNIKSRVSSYKGSFTIKSKPDKGSEFKILIPVYEQ